MRYNILFITTCTTDKYIINLLKSICENNTSLTTVGVILFQNGVSVPLEDYTTGNSRFYGIHIDGQVGLSKARNICMEYISGNNIVSDFVMFPDDDNSFDKYFFENFMNKVEKNSIIRVYCDGKKEKLYLKDFNGKELNISDMDYRIMSGNIIVTYDTYSNVGEFDENMGVGTAYGAGEDGDYFIRCCKYTGEGFHYLQDLWNFHPLNELKFSQLSFAQIYSRTKKYGRGVMYMCVKHRMYGKAFRISVYGYLGAMRALLKMDFKEGAARLGSAFSRTASFTRLLLKKDNG